MKSVVRLFLRLLLAACVVLPSAEAFADPLRIVIAAGHNRGLTGERPLKHADNDARSVHDVFVRLGGVSADHALLLQHPSADEVLHAIERAAHMADGHRDDDVSVLFYFSGHGDREAIHLGDERLPLDVIEARLASVKASLRIVVLDACRTNDGRAKGFGDADPFAVVLPETGGAKGTIRLQASADGEVAQESDDLGGAVFTHYWVNGLIGAADADNDGHITLGESYSYAYQQTLWRSAVSSGVAQRPSAVLDVREAAPLVLTRTTQSSAIRFPVSADTHYIVYSVGSQTVVGDLWGSPEHAATLAVTPGHYIVHRRGDGRSSAAEVAVAPGEARPLSSQDFLPFSEETLAEKGGTVVLHPNEVSAGYSAQSTTRLVSFGQEGDIRFAHVIDGWAIGGGAHGGAGTYDTGYWNTNVQWFGADVFVERRVPLGPATFRLGGGVVAEYVLQSLERADAAALAGTPYATKASGQCALAGGRVAVGVRVPIAGRLWLDVEAAGELLGTEMAGAATALVRGSGRAAVGWSF
jgi:hypothetical protein